MCDPFNFSDNFFLIVDAKFQFRENVSLNSYVCVLQLTGFPDKSFSLMIISVFCTRESLAVRQIFVNKLDLFQTAPLPVV